MIYVRILKGVPGTVGGIGGSEMITAFSMDVSQLPRKGDAIWLKTSDKYAVQQDHVVQLVRWRYKPADSTSSVPILDAVELFVQ